MSCISIPICLQTRGVHRNCNAPCDYTYTGRSRKQGNYNGVFLDYEGPSDSTSRDITKTSKWHGLRDTLATDLLHVGWQKNYSHIDRSNTGGVSQTAVHRGAMYYPKAVSVANCRPQRGNVLPHSCEAWL